MRYKDLKEMTFKEWDGKPYRAIVIDEDEDTLFITDVSRYNGREECYLVTGYDDEKWWCESNRLHWCHAYPIEWNKKLKKRMTNRQLSMWLAKGNGEYSNDRKLNSYQHRAYDKNEANKFVDDGTLVRKWDSEEWIEPTTDLLEDCN